MTKNPAENIQKFKNEIIQKVFGKKRIKIYPEKFLPTQVRQMLHSSRHFNLAEKQINTLLKENFRKLKRICNKKKAQYLKAETEYYRQLEKNLSYDIYPIPVRMCQLKINKEAQICFQNGKPLCTFDCFDKAMYFLCSTNKGLPMILIPKDKKIVRLAVKKYQQYVTKFTDQIVAAVMEKGFRKADAQLFAEQIIKEKFKT